MTDEQFKKEALKRANEKKRERKMMLYSGLSTLGVLAIVITLSFTFVFNSGAGKSAGNFVAEDAVVAERSEDAVKGGEVYDEINSMPYVIVAEGVKIYLNFDVEREIKEIISSLVFDSEETAGDFSQEWDGNYYEIFVDGESYEFNGDEMKVGGKIKKIMNGKERLDDKVGSLSGGHNENC